MFGRPRSLLIYVFYVISSGTADACLVNDSTVGYENGAVDLAFSVTVPDNELHTFQIARMDGILSPLTAIFEEGKLTYTSLTGGVESIGNISAGNLSIRIPSMNKSFADKYILKAFPGKQDIKCIELVFRVRPNTPVITNSDPSGNEVSGIEDKDVTLICRSTGGYPKPTMAWYRTSNHAAPLATNTDQPQRDDRTYTLEYTLRAVRVDDGATFICLSSYDPPDPLYMQADIKLNLSLKPATPMLSLHTPLQDNSNKMVIANCSTAGFKPETARLTLMLEGSTVVPEANSYQYSSDTFIATAEYSSTINKTLNGKLMACSVNHITLDAPLETTQTLDVHFAPKVATLSGKTSGIVADVKNKITLNCTAGSSNPPSNFTWYRNNIKIESNSQILQTSGEYNGHVTSQELVLEAVRDMDGDEIFCEVHNVVNGDNRLRSDTRTLDLRYHPTITVSNAKEATEGEHVALRCEASAKPAPTFRWYHNGVLLSSGRNISSNIRNHSNVLNIAAVNRTYVGVYKCHVSNGYQPDGNKEINLSVKFKPLTASLTGETRVVANGTNKVKMNCTTGSSNPKSTINWFVNDEPLSNDENTLDFAGQFNGRVTSQILEFIAERNMDGDEIECRAHNEIEPQSLISTGKTKLDLLWSMKSKALFNFVLGLSIGLVIAFIGLTFTTGPTNLIKAGYRQMTLDKMADTATDMRIHTGDDDDDVITLEELAKVQKYIRPVEFKDEHAHHDEDEVAKALKEKVRVLCWIMTSPDNLKKKAVHVRKTWAHRCNVLVFISSETNPDFPTVGLNVSEGREHLTGKTMQAFRYMYEHYFDDADWFMKADDDTYVIMENLRYFLSGEDKNAPIYFGHHFKTIVKQGYFSGGAGYVLSKEALRRFANSGNDSSLCRQDGGAEDAELGHCMERLGIKAGNSTDFMGRSRFHCFDPETHLQGGYPDWYYKYDANGAKKGKESISDYAISFHYVPPQKMYALEFFIYHLRPYGLHMGNQDLNQNHKSGK